MALAWCAQIACISFGVEEPMSWQGERWELRRRRFYSAYDHSRAGAPPYFLARDVKETTPGFEPRPFSVELVVSIWPIFTKVGSKSRQRFLLSRLQYHSTIAIHASE